MPKKKDCEEKIFTISLQKALAIVVGAVLTSVVGTAFTVGSILNSDHFTTLANAREIEVLTTNKMDKAVYEANQVALKEDLTEMKTDIKAIKTSLNTYFGARGVSK